jgi:hypothetical protein
MVDATIIEAPSSTKNASGERDPEMHQRQKGNNWYFGNAGGCRDHAHGAQAALAGRHGGHQPARRHLERSRGRTVRQPWNRADGQLESGAQYRSMFEPIHGSAFDITGKGIANPIGTFWSAVMMLDT